MKNRNSYYFWLLPVILIFGSLAGYACTADRVLPFTATQTASITPTPVTPSPTPTLTPTITPTPTPTPVPAVRIESGEKALFEGDWDAALTQYQAALVAAQNNPDSDPEIITAALLGIGRTYYLAGNYASALDYLRMLIDQYPDSAHRAAAFFTLAQTYTTLARYGEAADSYQRYLALRPGVIDAYVYELRGAALASAGDYSGSQVDYQSALQSPRAGDRTGLQIQLARSYAITGDYATALVMYGDIYTRTSSDLIKAQMDYLSGQAYMATNQPELAYAAYLDAVVNYPLAYDAYLSLVELVDAGYPVSELDRGLVDYFAGQYSVALAAFDRYLETSPSDAATAYYYKGLTLSEMGDYAGAIAQWDWVIENGASSGVWDNAWEEKGFTLFYIFDDTDQAVSVLAGYVAAAPFSERAAEFLNDAARVSERSDNLPKAAELWERVSAEYPASEYAFPALFQAGISRYRQQDFAGAQSLFERLLVTSVNITQRSTAYLWIGKCESALGDQPAALTSWAQAASVDPTGYYSERARDLLVGRAPFTPPAVMDLAFDLQAEKAEADAWMRQTFSLAAETDLQGLGPLAADERLTRGAELWDLGLYSEARLEFEDLRLAIATDPVSTYRLAGYLNETGLYRSSIMAARQVLNLAGLDDAQTLSAPIYFNHIRFGTYFSDLILPAAQEHGFNPLLLFSVVRQESLFEPFAASSASASGLMQIIPDTAHGIQAQLGWPENFTLSDLNRPLVSVTYGSDYLEGQLTYLDGDLFAALAAYNGGPGNALAWQSLAGGDPDLFLEIVRFDETRRYIRNIYEIFTIYRRLYDRTP